MQQIIKGIRRHTRELVRELNILDGKFQDTGFSYSECHVLFELNEHKLLNVIELSDLIQLDKSTVSRIVSKLTAQGYLKIAPHPEDKRQKCLSLTEEGLEAVTRNNCRSDDQVAAALRLLDDGEQEMALKGMQLYARALRHSRVQASYELRLIRKEDEVQVARLIRSVMTEYGAVGEGYSILDPEVDRMYEVYQAPGAAFFVIAKGDEILGCGGVAALAGGNPDTCELKKMYFYPAVRGLGFGKRLLSVCLQQATDLGYRYCYLETVNRMWQANLLYQRMGFRKIEGPMGCTGHNSCETFYVKELFAEV
ncbi:MAG: bifunctional helix-turn-helix transcriptional regulator/GNAT family N-acetyltransferase [Saprospiraceae bacterium]|nr:bifunctional helix-turn-helix transcriptional regulator/GNAT family N-acetyltransferase [Saprospiraceae bacterium]